MREKNTMIVSARNLTQKVVDEMRSRYAEVSISDDTMLVTDSQLDFREIVDRLQSAGATVRSAHIKEPTLEDVFLNLTGKELRE
jgi:ABC-2 type transport system ATP-binding protein